MNGGSNGGGAPRTLQREITVDELAAVAREVFCERLDAWELLPPSKQGELITVIANILVALQKQGFSILAPDEAARARRVVVD